MDGEARRGGKGKWVDEDGRGRGVGGAWGGAKRGRERVVGREKRGRGRGGWAGEGRGEEGREAKESEG